MDSWTVLLIGIGTYIAWQAGALLVVIIPELVESYKHKKWVDAENKKVEVNRVAMVARKQKMAQDAKNGVCYMPKGGK